MNDSVATRHDEPAMTRGQSDPEKGAFRVLATSAGFEPGFRAGGPIRSVTAIVDTISDTTDLWLMTRDRDLGSSEPYSGLSGRWVSRGRSRVLYLHTRKPGQWLRLWRELRAIPFDLLYVNSLWDPTFTIVPIVSAKLGVIRARRILLAPRGELASGALALKSRKKQLFLTLWRPFLESTNVFWHASSEQEAADIRAAFPRARIEVNQDQVSLPNEPLPAVLGSEGPARLVFIGRVSAMKNLDMILESLIHVTKPVEFDIYGPLEDAAYWSRCQASIKQVPPHVRVRYRGEVAPTEVRQTFSQYDAFVFPTRGENFGHVIAESLSASCPVICSDRTLWTSVLLAGGGVVLRDLSTRALGTELERLAAMTPRERLQARHDAATSYRSWRKSYVGANILEQVRCAESVLP